MASIFKLGGFVHVLAVVLTVVNIYAPGPIKMHDNVNSYMPVSGMRRSDIQALSPHAHLPSLPIVPAHPVAAISAVLDPVSLGELITHAVCVATLGAHQCDEVQRAQVHLEVLFEAVRL